MAVPPKLKELALMLHSFFSATGGNAAVIIAVVSVCVVGLAALAFVGYKKFNQVPLHSLLDSR